MKGTLRRLALVGIGALALLWATRPGRGSASLAGQDAAPEKSCATGACPVDASAALTVAAGDCRNFHASGEVFRSQVADPEVAQFVHYGPNDVGVRGLKPGCTTITIWSAATKKPVTLRVEVTDEPAGPELKQVNHEVAVADEKTTSEEPASDETPTTAEEPAADDKPMSTPEKLDDARPVAASAALCVAAGDCRKFHASGDVVRSQVADPEIAQFLQYTPNDVGVRGLKPGSTTIAIWSTATKAPVTLRVEVTGESTGPELKQVSDEVVQTGSAASLLPIAAAGPGLPITADTNYVQQVPAISLETSSPVMATVGKIVEQQILVKNVGSVAAEQVEVRGTVSIDSELISTEPRATIADSTMVWRIAKLPAGGEQKIIVRVKPLVAGELSCYTNVSFKSSASVKVQVTAAKLKLMCEGPTAVTVGTDVQVTMTVANTGTATAENVRIRQIVPTIQQTGGGAAAAAKPLVLEVGTLEPGESRVLEASSKAAAPGTVHIKLVAEARDGVNATAEHTLKVLEPKLTIATTGPDFRYLNRKATYQIAVSNPGDAPVTNLNVMVGLPEGLEFVDASHSGVFNSLKRTIAWTPGFLDGNRKLEYSITVMPRTEGEHLQRAVAWADNNLLVKADKVTRVEGLTSLALEVTDVEDPIEVGSETLYQIHITNKGSKTAERIQIIAQISEGLKVTGIESPGTYRVQGQQLVFEPIASMAPQATAMIQIRVKGMKTGSHAIRAMLSCPAMSNTIVTEESTAVYGD